MCSPAPLRVLWFTYLVVLAAARHTAAEWGLMGGGTLLGVLLLHWSVHFFLCQCFLMEQHLATVQGCAPRRFSWEPLNTWFSLGLPPQVPAQGLFYLALSGGSMAAALLTLWW